MCAGELENHVPLSNGPPATSKNAQRMNYASKQKQ